MTVGHVLQEKKIPKLTAAMVLTEQSQTTDHKLK